MAASATAKEYVQKMFLAYFGRPVAPTGQEYYATLVDAGNVAALQDDFWKSAESQAKFGSLSTEAKVNAIFQQLFGRDAALPGLTYWTTEINAGRVSLPAAALTILNSAAAADLAVFNAKLKVANAFTAQLDTTAEILGYQSNLSAAVTMLAGIKTTAQADAAVADITNVVANVVAGGTTNPGQTFTLTEGVDTVVGTAGNNTIDGSLKTTVAGRLQTWNNADQIDGGDGTDTLFAQLTANVTAASIKNVEILDIEAQANNLVVDLNTGDAALGTIKVQNSGANNFTVQNIQSAPTSYVLANNSGNFTATIVNARLAGAADAATIDLSNVTAGTVTLQTVTAANGYETINVNSNGTVANVLTNLTDGVATGLTTVNIAGSQALTLPLADTTVTTVNAATMTGALTLTVAAGNTQNMTVTGGTGNDVINMNGTFNANDTINGGDGTDRLVLTNAEAIAATTLRTGVSNIEVIGLSDGLNGAVAVNNFSATGLRFGANMAGNGTIGYAAGTNSLDLQTFTGNGNDLVVNVAGTATTDVLNLTVGSTAAGNNFSANSDVTINGAETVNLLSQGGANTFAGNATGFVLTDTAATQALVITGNQNIAFGTVRADSINASGMTGAATLTVGNTGTTATSITGTANGDTITGSTAGDIINGGAGADTIANVATANNATAGDVLTGGAGFDTFILRGDLASAALPGLYSNVAQITDFTVGSTATTTDILQLSATVGNYSGGSALFAGIAAAGAGATAIQTVAQNAAAAAIVNGTDLIKLTTGVATTGLTAQQAFNAAIGTGSVTGLTAGDDIFVSFYDITNSKMVIGLVDTGANTTVESADAITIIGSIDMTAADYAAFNANNLSIIAA